MKKKILSLALVFTMVLFLMPISSLAAGINTDINGHWAQAAIVKWRDWGIVQGSDGRFRPDDPITRGELAVVIDNIMKYQKEATNSFSDLGQAFYTDAVLKANAAGIILGAGNLIRPTDKITKEEAAVMLARALGVDECVTPTVNFADNALTSSWAVAYVNGMATKGFIQGYENNFNPKAMISRAEIVTILNNAIATICSVAKEYTGSVDGTVIVNTSGATLNNMTISGDLIISEGVGNGDLTLNNVIVTGNTIIRGGGLNSIHITGDSHISNIIMQKLDDGSIMAVTADGAVVDAVVVDDGTDDIILSGSFVNVTIAADVNVNAVGANIQNLNMTAAHSSATIDSKSTVKTLSFSEAAAGSTIENNGTIANANVNANGIIINGNVPASVKVGSNVTQGPTDSSGKPVTGQSTGGGGGGVISGGGGVALTVTGIDVTHAPNKISYVVGDTFDPAGMIVTATYNDNSTVAVTGYTWDPSGALTESDTEITITFSGKTTTQAITVSAKTVTGIDVTHAPNKTSYVAGETFTSAGMIVTATYNDNSTVAVTGYTWDPSGALTESDTEITITFSGKTTTQAITVSAKTVTGISVTHAPNKTSYVVGDTFNPAGMVITATYNDNSTAAVTGYTCDPSGALTESDTEIIVTFSGKTTTQAITVSAKTVTGIDVTHAPNKTSYVAGETFTSAGMVITATYNDNTTAAVTGYTCDPSGALTESDTEIIITYAGKTATQAITVSAKTVTGIAVTHAPNKISYVVGDTFSPTGMVITATYNDNSTATVTGYTCDPSGALTESDTEITITFSGKTATQAITVYARTPFEDGYPYAEDIESNSFDVLVKADKAVTFYYVAYPNDLGHPDPDADDVMAGTDGAGHKGLALRSGFTDLVNFSDLATSMSVMNVYGNRTYNVFIVAVDENSNKSAVVTLPVATLDDTTAPVVKSGYPIEALTGSNTTDVLMQSDEVSNVVQYHWVAYVRDTNREDPSPDDVMRGTDGDDSNAGVFMNHPTGWSSALLDTTLHIANLSASTTYDVFIVAIDSEWNESDVAKITVTTRAVGDSAGHQLIVSQFQSLHWLYIGARDTYQYDCYLDGTLVTLTLRLPLKQVISEGAWGFYNVSLDSTGEIITGINVSSAVCSGTGYTTDIGGITANTAGTSSSYTYAAGCLVYYVENDTYSVTVLPFSSIQAIDTNDLISVWSSGSAPTDAMAIVITKVE